MGGVTVLQKGAEDLIAVHPSSPESDPQTATVDVRGGLKRCGGQGDVLSGTVGTFLAWGKCFEDGAWAAHGNPEKAGISVSHLPFLAAIGGSLVTRTTSKRAFERNGRSMITADLIGEIGAAFEEIFGSEAARGKL